MTFRGVLHLAGLILLILAAVFYFGVGDIDPLTIAGVAVAGLAGWCAATLPLP